MSSEQLPWWKTLNRGHWFVFTMAALAWLFDCLDQQLFTLARPQAIEALLPPDKLPLAKKYAGLATALFVAGWGIGGLVFGPIGDRFGRARSLTITVLMYSLFTGLSALSRGFWDFAIYRFITGVGVGGVFGLSVALIADSLPERARPHALGLMQALTALANISAALIAVAVSDVKIGSLSSWQVMFLVGALPAFLCVFIQARLKEPEKWVQARANAQATGLRMGSYGVLLGDPRWKRRAFPAMLMCVSAVVGMWGIGFFSVELIQDVFGRIAIADNITGGQIGPFKTKWSGIALGMQSAGGFFGMYLFTHLAQRLGRKPTFVVWFIGATLSTMMVFQLLAERSHIFWMLPLMGFFQFGLFAGFAIYLPELFPLSLRSTGTSFCYNVGRLIAATGPLVQGWLTTMVAGVNPAPEAKLAAFRNACGGMSLIFILGIVALYFLPETKGEPLPED